MYLPAGNLLEVLNNGRIAANEVAQCSQCVSCPVGPVNTTGHYLRQPQGAEACVEV